MSKHLALGDLKPASQPPRTEQVSIVVAEWDVTPGLHDWIEQQVRAAEAAGTGNAATRRRCASDRKILAAHPYTTVVVNPGYGPASAGFGCETCHDWDGVPEGRGNCDTILALAEAHGLDSEADTETITY